MYFCFEKLKLDESSQVYSIRVERVTIFFAYNAMARSGLFFKGMKYKTGLKFSIIPQLLFS
ncbi:MAG: hypothetical protein A3B70_05590 [Deltaproteobacteria bacterium RIFCSPHIGHO2_02_FULL_40_11]|nr:MAG: hypothetical protein A3B70_05590 [Deltaproteobacteria bacterium RIFCSPHIGHO2_02_FULL_40_11]